MSFAWYSVRLEIRAPADEREVMVDDDAADELMALLEDHDGVVSSGTGSWSATISTQALGAVEAAISGSGLIEKMAANADMPAWPVVRAEAIRQDVLDAENKRPTLPELVSAPEAADILGVSPQRVHELAAGKAGFPEPVYELRTGKLWLRDAIEAFGRRWERKRGRPAKGVLTARPSTAGRAIGRLARS
jgi:hypothetical protein